MINVASIISWYILIMDSWVQYSYFKKRGKMHGHHSVPTSLCACLFVYVNTGIWMSACLCYQNKIILPLLLDIKLPMQFALKVVFQLGG